MVAGKLPAAEVLKKEAIKTLEGSELAVKKDGEKVLIGTATVAQADIMAENGVIHVIDSVLLPSTPAAKGPEAARQVIAEAVATGAPQYNQGEPEKCRDTYKEAVNKLLKMPNTAVPPAQVQTLNAALTTLDRFKGKPKAEAWVLRKALDKVYVSLPEKEPSNGDEKEKDQKGVKEEGDK